MATGISNTNPKTVWGSNKNPTKKLHDSFVYLKRIVPSILHRLLLIISALSLREPM